MTLRSLLSFILISATAWGFLASKEAKAAGIGNLGLQDRKSCSDSVCEWRPNSSVQNASPLSGSRNTFLTSAVILRKSLCKTVTALSNRQVLNRHDFILCGPICRSSLCRLTHGCEWWKYGRTTPCSVHVIRRSPSLWRHHRWTVPLRFTCPGHRVLWCEGYTCLHAGRFNRGHAGCCR